MNSLKELNSSLVLATSNLGKLSEFKRFLESIPIQIFPQPGDVHVIENGKTFSENARLKSVGVAKATGQWSLSDDSGLSVNSLHGAPGVHSSRYAANDSDRVARLLREMKGFQDRTAAFTAAICLSSPEGVPILEVEGHCNGIITTAPRGDLGFGYDPIFEVSGTKLTFAEMEPDLKRKFSHRGKAFDLLRPKLIKLLNEQNH